MAEDSQSIVPLANGSQDQNNRPRRPTFDFEQSGSAPILGRPRASSKTNSHSSSGRKSSYDANRHEDLIGVPRRSSFGTTMDGVTIDDQPAELPSPYTTARGASNAPSFKTKLKMAQKRDLLYELRADGTSEWRELSLREIFDYIMGCVKPISANTSPSSATTMSEPQKRLASRSAGSGNTHLHVRDLRQLFSANSASEPAIAVRRHVVLVNFETIRAIVLVDRLVLLVPSGADSELRDVEREVNNEHDEIPEFEIRAYEALLSVSSRNLARELKSVEPKVRAIVSEMEQEGGKAATSAEANERFRILLNTVSELDSRAQARRRALIAVLEEDDDLALMNLTKMKDFPSLYKMPLAPEVEEDHEEIELLLESFLLEINTLCNVLESMNTRLKNTLATIQVKLDIARNKLLTASTIFTMISMFLAFGAVATGLFGMNITNRIEDSFSWFYAVALFVVSTFIIGNMWLYLYFDRKGVWVS